MDAVSQSVCLTLLLFNYITAINLNDSCVTPNGQNATCIPLDSCVVIRDAITTNDVSAIQFYRQSDCGATNVPLVCCGLHATFKQNTTDLLANKNTCGISAAGDKIVGGKLTKIKEFPWMALLGYSNSDGTDVEYNCAGTLINERYILTAAHCLRKTPTRKTLSVVRLGEWRISTKDDCENEGLATETCADPVLNLKIERQISHSGYRKRVKEHDIGLLRLEKDVEYTKYVRPVCLPSLNEEIPNVGGFSIVTGWGTIENDSLSDIMLKARLSILPNDECVERLQSYGQVGENQLCAGGRRGIDACPGDSGGPLLRFLSGDKKQWFQDGIISWGVGCGGPYPGVYTRLSKYIDWILENISQ